jgi:hypothetical protein
LLKAGFQFVGKKQSLVATYPGNFVSIVAKEKQQYRQNWIIIFIPLIP